MYFIQYKYFLRFGARKNMKYYNKKYINNSIKNRIL